jgi:hypothetical protein
MNVDCDPVLEIDVEYKCLAIVCVMFDQLTTLIMLYSAICYF